jgi:hypothetical protein
MLTPTCKPDADKQAVINLPKLLNLLLSLDIREPTYLGTSLVRWPSYHNHFTGFLTGFNYGVVGPGKKRQGTR